jgi:hypothetical protein
MPVMGVLLRALLIVLGIAAVVGLGIVFAGPEDVVMRVLGSVLVLGGALLLAMPAVLAPWRALGGAMGALIAVNAVLVWVIIWAPGGGDLPEWIGRASAMIVTLLVVLSVGIVLERMTRGRRLRAPRRIAWVGDVAGVALLGMAWAMILTDGGADVPVRLMAGTAIIYAAAALGALVLAFIRSYSLVRRD